MIALRLNCVHHPDRKAISLSDDGKMALCGKCWRLWMNNFERATDVRASIDKDVKDQPDMP
jgi:hypothetical protein